MKSHANCTRQLFEKNLRDYKKDIKLRCYKVYARPVVKNASAVWDSSNKIAINKIENVQRKVATLTFQSSRKESSITKMLKDLLLDTIELQRN